MAAAYALPPVLAAWLRKHSLEFDRKLGRVFTEEELLDGSAAALILEEMGGAEEDIDDIGQHLLQLAAAAEADDSRVRRHLASLPMRCITAAAAQRREAEARERETARVEAAALSQKVRSHPPPPPVRKRFGTARQQAWAEDGGPRGRETAETAEQARWAERLRQQLVRLDAPIIRKVSGSRDPSRTLLLALGGRRASTVRARVREWGRYCQWLRRSRDLPPRLDDALFIDYLTDRADEPCTKSSLTAAYAAIKFIATVGGYDDDVAAAPHVGSCYRTLRAQALQRRDGGDVRQAPPPFVNMMVWMEMMVTSSAAATWRRVTAWWCLASAWAALRFDDHRGWDPRALEEDDDSWRFRLSRTKTTGPDKSVAARWGLVARGAYIQEENWFSVGWNVLSGAAPFERDYLLCQLGEDGAYMHRETTYMEFAGRLRCLIADMGSDEDGLGAEAAAYFTPHSFRAFLPSAMTAAGAPLEMLSWLAAWRTKGAATYSRTGASRTVRLQTKLAAIARAHRGKKDPFGERENARRLTDHLRKRGMEPERICEITELIAAFPDGASAAAAWDENPLRIDHDERDDDVEGRPHEARAGGAGSAASPPQKRRRESLAQPTTSMSTEITTGNYIITISAKHGLRRLHLVGACYRRPHIDYKHFQDLGPVCPSADCYDSYCKDCWRGSAGPSAASTGDSSDTSVATTDESSSTAREDSE